MIKGLFSSYNGSLELLWQRCSLTHSANIRLDILSALKISKSPVLDVESLLCQSVLDFYQIVTAIKHRRHFKFLPTSHSAQSSAQHQCYKSNVPWSKTFTICGYFICTLDKPQGILSWLWDKYIYFFTYRPLKLCLNDQNSSMSLATSGI